MQLRRIPLNSGGVEGSPNARISQLVSLEGRFGERPRPMHTGTDYDHLLNSIYDGLLITDLDGVVLECNLRAQEMFGLDADHLVRSRVLDRIAGAGPDLLAHLKTQVTTHQHTLIEATCLRGDASMFPAEIAVTELPGRTPNACCYFVRDVALRKQAEDDLQQANRQLVDAELARAHQEAMAELYHDIHNPLQILLSLAEMNGHDAYREPLDRILAVLGQVSQMRDAGRSVPAGAGAVVPAEDDWRNANPRRVLLADDEPQICDLFARSLAMQKPELIVDFATDGSRAVALFREHHHGVIVMDVNMPSMDGLAAYRSIFEHCVQNHWCLPPFVFCTAYALTPEIEEVIGDGSYHGFARKPLMLSALVAVVLEKLRVYEPASA